MQSKLCLDQYNTEQAELSWGSVQAETVGLQRQIDPSLMDIQVKLTEFHSQEWIIKFQISQSSDPGYLKIKKKYENMNFDFFWFKNNSWFKKVSIKKMQIPKNLWVQTKFNSSEKKNGIKEKKLF